MDKIDQLTAKIAELEKERKEQIEATREEKLKEVLEKIALYGFTAKELRLEKGETKPAVKTAQNLTVKRYKHPTTGEVFTHTRGRFPKEIQELRNSMGADAFDAKFLVV